MKDLNVIYRVCDSVSGTNAVRETGPKLDVLWKSFHSLVDSILYAEKTSLGNRIGLTVVFDNTTEKTIGEMRGLLAEKSIPFSERKTSDFGVSGNVGSFKVCWDVAKGLDGYIFFLEDDYVLSEECIVEMLRFLSLWNDESHVCLKPHQEIAEFFRDGFSEDGTYFRREVLLSSGRYWVRVKKSTCTFLVDDFILERCSDLFDRTVERPRLDETYLNEIYRRFPLFSPIEPLAEHFHSFAGMSPYFSWRRLEIRGKYDVGNLGK